MVNGEGSIAMKILPRTAIAFAALLTAHAVAAESTLVAETKYISAATAREMYARSVAFCARLEADPKRRSICETLQGGHIFSAGGYLAMIETLLGRERAEKERQACEPIYLRNGGHDAEILSSCLSGKAMHAAYDFDHREDR